MINEKPLNSNTVTPPEGVGSIEATTVATVVVSWELPVADVEVASELKDAMEAEAAVAKVVVVAGLAVVAAALLVSGQHNTL